jgi:hypothetical protein
MAAASAVEQRIGEFELDSSTAKKIELCQSNNKGNSASFFFRVLKDSKKEIRELTKSA